MAVQSARDIEDEIVITGRTGGDLSETCVWRQEADLE